MGRPSKFNPRRRKSIVSALRQGLTRLEAAERVDVSDRTLADWLQRGREEPGTVFETFLLDVEQAEREARLASQEPRARPWRGVWVGLEWDPEKAITYPPGASEEEIADTIQRYIDEGRLILADDGIVRPREMHARYFRWVASGRPNDDPSAKSFRDLEETSSGRWSVHGDIPPWGAPFAVELPDGSRLEFGGSEGANGDGGGA